MYSDSQVSPSFLAQYPMPVSLSLWEHQEGSSRTYPALRGEGRNSLFLSLNKGDSCNGKRNCSWWSCPAGLQPRGEAWGMSDVLPPAGWAPPGSIRGFWVRAVKQRETMQSKVKLGNKCETETRGSTNDRFKVFKQGFFFSKFSALVCGIALSV